MTHEFANLLMKEILPLKDQKWIDASRVCSVVEQLQITEVEARIYFLRELQGIIRRMPLKVFSEDEGRLRLIAAIQESLDLAIDEEEE